MPEPDVETTIRRGGSGGDGRVTCETLFNDSSPETPPDFPADSIYLSREEEIDWFDRNVFYQRKESTKAMSRSTSNPNSQRFSSSKKSSNSKASIIGLPKTQRSSFPDSKHRRCVKPENSRFFPKRFGSAGKTSLRLCEPSSPNVSCMGRVRSNKEKTRRRSKKSKPEKTGFWSRFKDILLLNCRGKHAVEVDEPSVESPPRKSVTARKSTADADGPPSLGGLNRFVSGRRSDSWVGDVEGHHPA